ncbi:MAG: 2-succinyl-5-enolpyruvyl-6-hydroxy-3-cyclohexene-1-carboxylic-acid synthase, partial [Acidimicrobiia bacterium]
MILDNGHAPNGSTAMASVIVDELARNQIHELVLAPGSRSAAIALAGAANPNLRLWVEVDERSAGFFAVGLGKAGRLAAVLTTSGTAAANLYPAVVEADQAQTHLLVLTADRPHELRATGANQTIDQTKLYSDRVRWFADIPAAEDRAGEAGYWRSTVCRAIAQATGWNGVPGPVHLNLAFREPLIPETDDGRVVGNVYVNSLDGRPGNAPWILVESFDESSTTTRQSHPPLGGRVLVVAGDGADPRKVMEALAAGCVVIAEGHSGCRVPGTITTAHHLLASTRFVEAIRPDVAVVLGRAGLSRNLGAFLDGVDTIAVGRGWADPDRRVARLVPGISFTDIEPDRDWLALWNTAELLARQILDGELDSAQAPNEPRTARDTASAVPQGGKLVVASSMPVRDVDWFADGRSPMPVIANRGASGVDGFVSLALGAAAVSTPVVALAGDLSLLHDQNGFLVEPRPDLVMVVVNNDGGGIFSFLPQARLGDQFDRLFGTPTGIDLGSLAAVYGLAYRRVDKAAELEGAIGEAIESRGVHLLEVRTDRSTNVELHRRITARVVEEIEAS